MSQDQAVNGSSNQNDEDEIYSTGASNRVFINHPPGSKQAVIVDVRDLGEKEVFFEGQSKGKKPHILLTFQTKAIITKEAVEEALGREVKEDDYLFKKIGERYVVSQQYVNSFAPRAKLRNHIKSLMGRDLSADELKPRGFKLSSLIGMNAYLTIAHSEPKDGRVYANITNVSAWDKDLGAPIEPLNFVRWKDRPKDGENPSSGQTNDSERQLAVGKLKALLNEGQSYGLAPKAPIDFDKLEMPAIMKAIQQWQTHLQPYRDNAEQQEKELAGADEDDAAPAATPVVGGDASRFNPMAEEGEPGYIGDENRRRELLMQNDASKTPIANLQANAAVDSDPSGSAAYDQKWSDIAQAQWTKNGNEPLSSHVISVIDAIEDAEWPVDVNSLIASSDVIGPINAFLKGQGRKEIKTLADLKTAQATLVKNNIVDATISK